MRTDGRWGCVESGTRTTRLAAFAGLPFAHPRQGLSLAERSGLRSPTSSSSSSIPGYKAPSSPVCRPRTRPLPPRPLGGGPGSQDWSWAETQARSGVNWQAVGAASLPCPGRSVFQRGPGVEDSSRVQGARAAPGRRQTAVSWPAWTTNPAQPRAAARDRATANRSRESASDRPGLGTLAGSSRWRRCMGPGPTSGHWPRATAGGPSSWREKGQVTRSEPSPALSSGARESEGNRGRGGYLGRSRRESGEP